MPRRRIRWSRAPTPTPVPHRSVVCHGLSRSVPTTYPQPAARRMEAEMMEPPAVQPIASTGGVEMTPLPLPLPWVRVHTVHRVCSAQCSSVRDATRYAHYARRCDSCSCRCRCCRRRRSCCASFCCFQACSDSLATGGSAPLPPPLPPPPPPSHARSARGAGCTVRARAEGGARVALLPIPAPAAAACRLAPADDAGRTEVSPPVRAPSAESALLFLPTAPAPARAWTCVRAVSPSVGRERRTEAERAVSKGGTVGGV